MILRAVLVVVAAAALSAGGLWVYLTWFAGNLNLDGRRQWAVVRVPTATPAPTRVLVLYATRVRPDFPTLTPTPTPTPWPTEAFVPLATATPVAVRPVLDIAAVRAAELDPGQLGCTDYYRRMLIDYQGRESFGPSVAYSISDRLVAIRDDCAAAGWAPEFSFNRVCLGYEVAGITLSSGLVRTVGEVPREEARGTGRDESGNILVHFARMSLADGLGCWYYQASSQQWAWVVYGEGNGVDLPQFPACNGLLRDLLAERREYAGGGAAGIARAIDRTRFDGYGVCSDSLWNLFPVKSGSKLCGVQSDTGITADGSLVVNWHAEYPPAGGDVCWVLRSGRSEWEVYPYGG